MTSAFFVLSIGLTCMDVLITCKGCITNDANKPAAPPFVNRERVSWWWGFRFEGGASSVRDCDYSCPDIIY